MINGGLECPAYAGGWHHKAVKLRMNRYCHASLLLSIPEIGDMSGCKGMSDSLEECLSDGTCPYCNQMNGEEVPVIRQTDDQLDYGDENEMKDANETMVEEITTNATSNYQEFISQSPTAAAAGPSTSPPSLAGSSETSITSTVLTSSPSGSVPSVATSSPPVGNITASPTVSSMIDASSSFSPSAAQVNSTSVPPVDMLESSSSFPSGRYSTSPTSALSETINITTESYNETTAPSSSEPVHNSTSEYFNTSISPTSTISAEPSPGSEPENAIPTWSPTATATEAPSYSPTTPSPTMGPCDGEPCPDQLCR